MNKKCLRPRRAIDDQAKIAQTPRPPYKWGFQVSLEEGQLAFSQPVWWTHNLICKCGFQVSLEEGQLAAERLEKEVITVDHWQEKARRYRILYKKGIEFKTFCQ